MARDTTDYVPLRTLRQRGSAFLGWAAVLLCGSMVVLSALSGEPSLTFIGIMLVILAVSVVCLVRPSVVLTQAGVQLRNPFRHTSIPWSQLQDVSARWNLELWSGDKAYPAWAIASHVQRPRPQGMIGFGRLTKESDAAAAPPPTESASVGNAARLIETAMGEYAELVADRDSAVVTGGELTRRWQWVDIAAVAAPVLVIVVGLLL